MGLTHRLLQPIDPPAVEAVWIRVETAAALLDLTPEALRCRLRRTDLPPGILKKWGRAVLLHRQRLLDFVETGAGGT